MVLLLLMLLAISLMLVAAWLPARICLKRSPETSAKLAVTGIVFAASVGPLSYVVPAGLFPSPSAGNLAESTESPVPAKRNALSSSEIGPSKLLIGLWQRSLARVSQQLPENLDHPQNWHRFVYGVCLLPILWSAVRFVLAWRQAQRLCDSSFPCCDTEVQGWLGGWAAAARRKRELRVQMSPMVAAPCVTWRFRDAILVPADFATWDRDERLAALAHEASHHFRCDPRWRLVADFAELTIAFHPLSRLLKRHLILAQELATDRAACQLIGRRTYERGLCKIGLRLDDRRQTNMSGRLSVSSHQLIRRIQMLKSPTTHFPNWLSRTLVPAVAATCGLIVVATLAAQESLTLPAPLEVAKREVAAEIAAGEPPFQRPASRPWESIGASHGYARVLPRELARKPFIAQAVHRSQASMGLPSGSGGVELTSDWLVLESNTQLSFGVISDAAPSEARHSLSFGADKAYLQFARPLDWTALAEHVVFGAILSREQSDAMRTIIRDQGTSATLKLITPKQDSRSPSGLAERVWPLIDGGVVGLVTAVGPMPSDLASDADGKALAADRAWLRVAEKTQMFGLGADTSEQDARNRLRLVFVPRADIMPSELQSQVEAAIQATLNLPPLADAEVTAADQARLRQLQHDMQSWQSRLVEISAAQPEDPQVVIVEGVWSDTVITGVATP